MIILNTGLAEHIPKSHTTMRNWVVDAWKQRQEQLKKELASARSNIHISFDLWSSPNHYAMLGVVFHWIDGIGTQRTDWVALRALCGPYSGENIAELLLQIFNEYAVSDRIGYFILDNASSNDIAVDTVFRKLCPKMPKIKRQQRRLRCLGHIINLCAQALILGKDADKSLRKLEAAHIGSDWEKIGKIWRKHGSIGKLHNIIRYIRMTPQRRQEFATYHGPEDISHFDGLEVS